MAVATKRKLEMMSYLNSGYDVMNYFAKFEKIIPHSINYTKFYDCWKSNARIRPGGFFAPHPYKIGSQNTPYKLGLRKDTPLIRIYGHGGLSNFLQSVVK